MDNLKYDRYCASDIQVQSIDSSTIVEVYKEAVNRFDGTWEEDEEGAELQRRANGMIKRFLQQYGNLSLNLVTDKWTIRELIFPI